jgi:hypothetical protein
MDHVERLSKRLAATEARVDMLYDRLVAAEAKLENAKGVVLHGTNAAKTRPDFISVDWIGPVVPAHYRDRDDTWVN